MNIKQIRYFASVYACGSLSAAAKEQYVTVQAVSKAIADLERELQSSLFVRESRGVRATPFGKSFYLKAEPLLRSFEELENFAPNHASTKQATLHLSLCTPAFHGSDQACSSISSFICKNLGLPTVVQLDSVQHAVQGLMAGTVDALITVGTYDCDQADCVPLGTVSPALIMASSHPLAHDNAVRVADAANYSAVVSEGFETFNNIILSEYPARGLDVQRVKMTTESLAEHLFGRNGLSFAVGIPALGDMFPHAVMRPFAPEDAVAIPICLVSPRVGKSPLYHAVEHWLAGELARLGGDSFKKFTATAIAAE